MIDFDKYLPSDYKGVAFHTTKIVMSFSKRLDEKKYPFSDKHDITEMGNDPKQFTLDVFVLGQDYLQQRKDLEAAFESRGPGILTHPTRGQLFVQVRRVETTEDFLDVHGVFDYRVTFVEVDEQQDSLPIASFDTQASVVSAASDVDEITLTVYEQEIEQLDNPEVLENFQEDHVAYGDTLNSLSGFLGDATPKALLEDFDGFSDVQTDLSDFGDGVSQAKGFLKQSQGFVGQWYDLTDSQGSLNFLSGVLGLGGLQSLMTKGFLNAFDVGNINRNNNYSYLERGSSSIRNQNSQALGGFYDVSLTNTTAKLLTAVEFDNVSMAVSSRDLVTNGLEAALESPLNNIQPEVIADYRASLRGLRTAIWRDMNERVSELPSLETYQPQAVTPARVLAYQLNENANDLVRRNGVKHPSFVPSAKPLFYKKGAA